MSYIPSIVNSTYLHRIYIAIFLLLIIGLLIYRYLTCPCNIDRNSLPYVPQSNGAEPERYEKQCAEEIKTGLQFPLAKVEKAVVTNGLFSLDHKVDKKNIPGLLDLLNDTASYVWGEVGTFMSEKRIVFYSNEGKVVGITDIDGPFTYSYPYLNRMKWGTLTETAWNKLNSLIY